MIQAPPDIYTLGEGNPSFRQLECMTKYLLLPPKHRHNAPGLEVGMRACLQFFSDHSEWPGSTSMRLTQAGIPSSQY